MGLKFTVRANVSFCVAGFVLSFGLLGAGFVSVAAPRDKFAAPSKAEIIPSPQLPGDSEVTLFAASVTSLTLSPSTIAGGSGAYSTATVTLSEPAPAGGTVVTLASSNTELAASAPSITVAEGATSATFRVWTNAFYRRYSGLGFSATISASTSASTASATLTVTAQARPPDITGPDSDMTGLNCGGHSPDVNILTDCQQGPNLFTPGPCNFVEECALGCQDLLDEGTQLNAACSTTPPFPVILTPKYVVGGGTISGTIQLPAGASNGTTALVTSNSFFTTVSPQLSFSVPTGAATAGFTIATAAVSVATFAAIGVHITVPETTPSGSTFFATRSALTWLAIAPAAGTPEVDLATLTLNPSSVIECSSSQGTVTLTAPAPTDVQVFMESDRPDIVDVPVSLPFSVIVPTGATSTAFTVNTRPASTSTVVNITARLTGVSQTAGLMVSPVGAPALSNVSLSPSSVIGGESSTGTVTLNGAAPAGGIVVQLTSGHPPTVQVPPSVTVPAGQTSATFPVTTSPVTTGTVVAVFATRGCFSPWASLVVSAPPPPPTLSSLSISPISVLGGTSATGTVTLTGAAGSGGHVVSLSSSNTAVATVPDSVTVPSGATSANFTVSTVPVAASTTVTITGVSGSTTRTVNLTVVPPASDTGLRSPTANAADTGGDGNGFESNSANAHADDNLSAVDNNGGTQSSTSCTSTARDRHRFYNYGFSVPGGSSIPGIEVRLDARVENASDSPRMCVQLSWDGGTSWTAAKSTPNLTTTMSTYLLGGPTDTWGRTWSPAEFSNANFRVRVINVANSNNRDFSLDWIPVRVYLGGASAPDTTPPTVSITSPAAGATVSGTTTISADASDNVGVTGVEFFVDGVLLSTDTTSPYSASWNTTTVANGSHTLTARASDAANNQTISAGVTVTVNNGTPPVLDITMSGVPASIPRGQFFTATATVTNTGGTSASGLSVAVSFNPSDSMRLENPQSATQTVATVAPGGNQSVSWLIRADRASSATLTFTLRNASGGTVDIVSQAITITN